MMLFLQVMREDEFDEFFDEILGYEFMDIGCFENYENQSDFKPQFSYKDGKPQEVHSISQVKLFENVRKVIIK